jgi:hypothetical protein
MNIGLKFHAKINHFEKKKDYVIFFIIIINLQSGEIKSIRRRYSEIKKFHE